MKSKQTMILVRTWIFTVALATAAQRIAEERQRPMDVHCYPLSATQVPSVCVKRYPMRCAIKASKRGRRGRRRRGGPTDSGLRHAKAFGCLVYLPRPRKTARPSACSYHSLLAYRAAPLLVRKAPRKTPAPPSQAGRGKFVWDHRMTGPEGRPFPGADSGLAQSAPRTSACKDVHALWLTEVGRTIL
jgi:hypothetical protein